MQDFHVDRAMERYAGGDGAACFSRLAVKLGDRFILVQMRDVFWIQSKGNLLCLHLQDADYDCRMTMNDVTKKLDPNYFLRVHRNAIVNLDYVVEFCLPHDGNAYVLLRNGTVLPISRSRRMALRHSILSKPSACEENNQHRNNVRPV